MHGDWEACRCCDAGVQCNFPILEPQGDRSNHPGSDQVLWVQRTVFDRGRFVEIRELGSQTDFVISEEFQEPCFPSVVNAVSSSEAPSASDSSRADARVAAPYQRDHSSPCESRGSKQTPRAGRPVTGSSTSASLAERRAEDIQAERQHVFDLTHGALVRARALEDHVQDLNRLASAALIGARQFQSDFNPNHAFECGSRRWKRSSTEQSCDQWSLRSSQLRQGSRGSSRGKSCGKSNALPDLASTSLAGNKSARCQAPTKMPWQELQSILSGCPDAALASKVFITTMEPWRPTMSAEPPSIGSSLGERLASSAAVYLPCEQIAREKKLKASRVPKHFWGTTSPSVVSWM